ncbi:nucleotide-binding protein [Pseudonocardia sp. TRM90224]|uniref:nucleotide-binding protein n=1 Tax=Pseudonocardia sp. TRM90224 TaxID=2812678 RepID=UPI001E5272C7|nr:AAA family ATPase [Pseudonocardia sp. TRM90224]
MSSETGTPPEAEVPEAPEAVPETSPEVEEAASEASTPDGTGAAGAEAPAEAPVVEEASVVEEATAEPVAAPVPEAAAVPLTKAQPAPPSEPSLPSLLPPAPRPEPRLPTLAPPEQYESTGPSSELTDYTIVRRRPDVPGEGWRRVVYKLSGGTINPGLSPAEKRRKDQVQRARRPLPSPHHVAVLSLKGGVGKTTVSAVMGLLLAEYRGDRVVALDANPDAGTLADRLTGESEVTVRNLIENIGGIGALPDVARYTSLAGRLQVVASEQDPAMSEAFTRAEYEQVCTVLRRFYNIVITDSGTGLVHSAMDGTLALAHSIVVVGSLTVDGASRASKTLDWLVAHGFREAVARAVVVLSRDRTSKEIDANRLKAHFAERCRAVVEIPPDEHLATGGRIALSSLRTPTTDAFLELVALVADEFGSEPPARLV